jgi:hypothetical protein
MIASIHTEKFYYELEELDYVMSIIYCEQRVLNEAGVWQLSDECF